MRGRMKKTCGWTPRTGSARLPNPSRRGSEAGWVPELAGVTWAVVSRSLGKPRSQVTEGRTGCAAASLMTKGDSGMGVKPVVIVCERTDGRGLRASSRPTPRGRVPGVARETHEKGVAWAERNRGGAWARPGGAAGGA